MSPTSPRTLPCRQSLLSSYAAVWSAWMRFSQSAIRFQLANVRVINLINTAWGFSLYLRWELFLCAGEAAPSVGRLGCWAALSFHLTF